MNYGDVLSPLIERGGVEVAVVEPDARHRMLVASQLPGAQQLESVQELVQRVQPGRPIVVVFGPGVANPFGFQQVHRVTTSYPEVGAVFAVEELSTDLLQQALRAGARDTVALSGGADLLLQSVSRVGELLAKPSRVPAVSTTRGTPGRLIVVFSPKGGVGKSTIAINVAVSMARGGTETVCLVDADLQFGDVAVLLSLPPQHTVLDATASVQFADPELLRTLLTRHHSGLLVLPAPVEPVLGEVIRPDEMIGVCSALQAMCGHVVVDCPTRFDDVTFGLIEAADEVLLVGSMEIPSVKSLKIGMQALDLMSVAGPKLRLVLNRANTQVKLDVREVEQVLGLRAEFPIPSDIAVPLSVNAGVPVVLHEPKSAAARAFDHIASSLVGAGVGTEDRRLKRRRKR